ncbi:MULTISPECIES: metallophosphoesterase [Microbacterium]|uniref:Phosphodiesterase YaeI n=1 Tax=Microbacterium trichothecenolyticum TaxID=69370 RepID=A0A0M2HFN4_MICTR|nr:MULTISPECIES: metallophosphoesterase [Microbacterium]KJL43074.1 phosphodiesterase YaeI [Microbacterium trichothecenolyticum]MDR7190461.1 putative MPP superfamily phosphohydrolase [Microbacterium sp. BE35]
MPSTTTRTALTVLGTVGAVGAGAAAWGIGIERYLFTVRFHEVPVLPAGAKPLRVLHLSDAHMAPWQHRKQEWIARLAEFQPDLIVNTGDNMGHFDGLRGLRRAYDPLRGVPGVFVHGSNDHAAPSPRNPFLYFTGPSKVKHAAEPLDTDALDDYLARELGWLDLNNRVGSLDAGGLRIAAFGVSDAHRHWDRLEALPEPLAALRDGQTFDLSIGVTHAPYRRVLDDFVGLGADAIFGGHTHGGQVRVPGFGALVANCDIPLRQARGLSAWEHDGHSVPLNVSAGLGHSIYAPVRFACRPEASLLTLVPRA